MDERLGVGERLDVGECVDVGERVDEGERVALLAWARLSEAALVGG